MSYARPLKRKPNVHGWVQRGKLIMFWRRTRMLSHSDPNKSFFIRENPIAKSFRWTKFSKAFPWPCSNFKNFVSCVGATFWIDCRAWDPPRSRNVDRQAKNFVWKCSPRSLTQRNMQISGRRFSNFFVRRARKIVRLNEAIWKSCYKKEETNGMSHWVDPSWESLLLFVSGWIDQWRDLWRFDLLLGRFLWSSNRLWRICQCRWKSNVVHKTQSRSSSESAGLQHGLYFLQQWTVWRVLQKMSSEYDRKWRILHETIVGAHRNCASMFCRQTLEWRRLCSFCKWRLTQLVLHCSYCTRRCLCHHNLEAIAQLHQWRLRQSPLFWYCSVLKHRIKQMSRVRRGSVGYEA